jgi:DNA-binding CsgD family transcriptional regulator
MHLTSRESEVLRLVLEGEPNEEIAARLGIAEQSAKEYVSGLLRRFGVRNRAALADVGGGLAEPLSTCDSVHCLTTGEIHRRCGRRGGVESSHSVRALALARLVRNLDLAGLLRTRTRTPDALSDPRIRGAPIGCYLGGDVHREVHQTLDRT